MPTQFWIVFSLVISLTLGVFFLPSTAQARCGYYVGYGYRCFGDKGGTGGKVFKDMDKNSKKCGYFDPGCQSEKRKKPVKRGTDRPSKNQ